MLLDSRLEAIIKIEDRLTHSTSGRPFFQASLVSEDGQTLQLFEGQMKELPDDQLQVGKRYRVVFRPFINHHWVELKIASLELE